MLRVQAIRSKQLRNIYNCYIYIHTHAHTISRELGSTYNFPGTWKHIQFPGNLEAHTISRELGSTYNFPGTWKHIQFPGNLEALSRRPVKLHTHAHTYIHTYIHTHLIRRRVKLRKHGFPGNLEALIYNPIFHTFFVAYRFAVTLRYGTSNIASRQIQLCVRANI